MQRLRQATRLWNFSPGGLVCAAAARGQSSSVQQIMFYVRGADVYSTFAMPLRPAKPVV